MIECRRVNHLSSNDMLSIRALFTSLDLFHFVKQDRVFGFNGMISFLLVELACALFVLVKLLFHTHIICLNYAFLLLFIVLSIDLI